MTQIFLFNNVASCTETTYPFDVILFALWRHEFCDLTYILSPLLSSLKYWNPCPVKDFSLMPYSHTQPMPRSFTWARALTCDTMVSSASESRLSQWLTLRLRPRVAENVDFLTYDDRMRQLSKMFLPNTMESAFYNLTVSRHASLVPHEREALSGCQHP